MNRAIEQLRFSRALGILVLLLPHAAAAGQERSDMDNVVIVLDASGSMQKPMIGSPTQPKIDAAKAAIGKVLERVPPSTQVGLLVFSGKNKRQDWVHPLGPRDDSRMIADLYALRPKGGTPLGRYMKFASDRLLEQRAQQNGYGTYRLLIVTDGQADKDDQPLVDQYLPDILARGLVVDVIGVSMEEEHVLATRVHSYRSADDPTSLEQALTEVFAEVSDQGATGTSFEEGRELLEALPDDLALPVLAALSTHNDEPIGRLAPSAASEGSAPGPSSGAPGKGSSGKQGNRRNLFIFAGLFLLILILRRRSGGRRRNRFDIDSD